MGVADPRLVTLPYLVGGRATPGGAGGRTAEEPLFLSALVDHCRSNASPFWFANQVAADGATYNGGSRYLPKTDGRRNDCFERLFLTVSPRFEEVLPNIPNPKSPWMHVAGERLWIAHGASNRQHDYDFWKKVARYGMTKVVITDHETGWRDGGESFTFRTRAAPGKGGDEGQADYARKIHALGFRYGIYNNYTDFAPVNEYWNEDCVTRLPDGKWQTAWARCYNPKPARAVEFEAAAGPHHPAEVPSRHGLLRRAHRGHALDLLRLRRPRARCRHLRRHVLRLRRDHAPPEEDLERPGLQRRQ